MIAATPQRDAPLRISLLGPVRAWGTAGELELGSGQRKAVLSVLAMRANQLVTKGELVDAVWGETAPASAYGGIHTHISALRKRLEPRWARRSTGEVLVSTGSGYRLALSGCALDVERFRVLRERARERQRGRDVAGELAALDSALELWRGEALDGVSGPHASWQRTRLAELRLGAVERRARLMVNAGARYAVIDELDRLCRSHPLREESHSLLMHALYLADRRGDAIDVFHRLRSATVEQLGTEPGPGPSALYGEILRDDPALRWTRDEPTGPARPIPLAVRSRPDRPRGFTGRGEQVALLRAAAGAVAAGTGGVVRIEGPPGAGKSALLAEGLAETPGCQLAWSVADELGQQVPLHTVLDGLDVTALSPDPRRAALAALARQVEPERLDRDTVAAAVEGAVELVHELCADGPLVVVVDQLQWADPLSLLVLRRLLPATAERPLLVVTASRPALRRELEPLWAAATRATTITLGPRR
ncbi:BTAD domain-containing putative transcriptional regulator [Actinophytocola xanthii]|nr:BTAD domain-containing putative transcriptional regulator [Actinophytocola xanthii]